MHVSKKTEIKTISRQAGNSIYSHGAQHRHRAPVTSAEIIRADIAGDYAAHLIK